MAKMQAFCGFIDGFKSRLAHQKRKSRNHNGYGIFLVIPTVSGALLLQNIDNGHLFLIVRKQHFEK